MKTKKLIRVIAPLMCLALSPTVFGQMSGNNLLFTPTGNLSAGPQNTTVGRTGSDAIYPVANMAYNLNVVPEPTSLGLLGLGAALYSGLGRKRKN